MRPSPGAELAPYIVMYERHHQYQGKKDASRNIRHKISIGINPTPRILMGKPAHHSSRTVSMQASEVLSVVAVKSAAAASFLLQKRRTSRKETSGRFEK